MCYQDMITHNRFHFFIYKLINNQALILILYSHTKFDKKVLYCNLYSSE